jgi:hypothetical protein
MDAFWREPKPELATIKYPLPSTLPSIWTGITFAYPREDFSNMDTHPFQDLALDIDRFYAIPKTTSCYCSGPMRCLLAAFWTAIGFESDPVGHIWTHPTTKRPYSTCQMRDMTDTWAGRSGFSDALIAKYDASAWKLDHFLVKRELIYLMKQTIFAKFPVKEKLPAGIKQEEQKELALI